MRRQLIIVYKTVHTAQEIDVSQVGFKRKIATVENGLCIELPLNWLGDA